MGAKDSKTSSRYSEKGDAEDDIAKLMTDKQKTRTRKYQSQKFKSKLNSDAEAFAPSAKPVEIGDKYSDQKDEPWVQFLMQKERERPRRSNEQIASAVPKQSILLQTGEYLKLLKSVENPNPPKKGKGAEKPTLPRMAEGTLKIERTFKKDISVAVDEIIQSRCKQEKPATNIISNENAILNIAKLLKVNAPISEVAASRKAENVASTQDDIMLEKLNRDEDLADPVYWSEDERSTRLPRPASAHKLGHRPRNDPAFLREYVMQDLDSQLDKEVAKLLLNANRLSTRHKALEPNIQVRYMVSGIKDVCRALKYGKVKAVIIAPDIEDSSPNGGVDDRLRDILGSAYQADVPVVFALSRVRMGMAFGKSLKMSVVGLQETKGLQEQFDTVLSSAYEKRVSWTQRKLPR